MQIVRRHRRAIMFVFGLMALVAMSYGFLKRVGIDPLERFRPDPDATAPASSGPAPGTSPAGRR